MLLGLVTVAALATSSGCAPRAGWDRTQARACEPKGPPVLCFDADPDQPLALHAANAVLLPGECAVGPERRGGSMALRVVDGRGPTWRGRVHLAGGKRTTVTVEAGKRRLVRVRQRCTRSP